MTGAASGEEAVQEPPLCVAENPCPLPLRVAGDEILALHVAGRTVLAGIPPAAFQTLAACQQLQRAAPVRAVAPLTQGLRFGQQPQRPRRARRRSRQAGAPSPAGA